MKAPSLWELSNQYRKSFSQKYCLHPEAHAENCQGNIIKAHTIQRAGGLTRIAENGHVFTGYANPTSLPNGPMNPIAKLIGIQRASTFTGFCARHDDQLFAPIEKVPFRGCPEQILLLGYRALCREVFTKKAANDFSELLRDTDKGKDQYAQELTQGMLNEYRQGLKAGLEDLERHKKSYENILLKRKFSEINFFLLELSSSPDVLASFSCHPEYDFHGTFLQDLSKIEPAKELIAFSIIPTDQGGAVVFSWIGEVNGACNTLIQSLGGLTNAQTTDAVVRFAFEHGENTFFSPSWWRTLRKEAQEKVLRRLDSGILRRRDPNCLIEDTAHLVNWEVVARKNSLKWNDTAQI